LAANTPVTAAPTDQQPGSTQTPPVPVQSGANSAQRAREIEAVNQWAAQAETQFQRGNYREALQSCDAALHLDPSNARVVQLKTKVEETMRILGKN
jgi:Flp pilus assembly protein TadD